MKSEELLTPEAFTACLLWYLTHPNESNWYWLCLSEKARQEMLDKVFEAYGMWVSLELQKEQERKPKFQTESNI